MFDFSCLFLPDKSQDLCNMTDFPNVMFCLNAGWTNFVSRIFLKLECLSRILLCSNFLINNVSELCDTLYVNVISQYAKLSFTKRSYRELCY